MFIAMETNIDIISLPIYSKLFVEPKLLDKLNFTITFQRACIHKYCVDGRFLHEIRKYIRVILLN